MGPNMLWLGCQIIRIIAILGLEVFNFKDKRVVGIVGPRYIQGDCAVWVAHVQLILASSATIIINTRPSLSIWSCFWRAVHWQLTCEASTTSRGTVGWGLVHVTWQAGT